MIVVRGQGRCVVGELARQHLCNNLLAVTWNIAHWYSWLDGERGICVD